MATKKVKALIDNTKALSSDDEGEVEGIDRVSTLDRKVVLALGFVKDDEG